MKLSTFKHPVFGFFTLPRHIVRQYNAAQLYAAAELILQSGE